MIWTSWQQMQKSLVNVEEKVTGKQINVEGPGMLIL